MVSGVLEPMRLAAMSRPRQSMRDPELSNEDRMAIFIEQGLRSLRKEFMDD